METQLLKATLEEFSFVSTDVTFESDVHPRRVSESSTIDGDETPITKASEQIKDDESIDFLDEAVLKQHFAFRDKLLDHFSKTKNRKELQLLRENETTFRSEAMAFLKKDKTDKPVKTSEENMEGVEKEEKKEKESTKESTITTDKKTVTSKTEPLIQKLRRYVMFEVNFAFSGYLNCLVYCLAHAAAYDFLTDLIEESTRSIPNQDLVHFCILLFGLFLARITGGVWIWINDETEEELEKRQDEFRPLMMLDWFKAHDELKEALNVLSFLLCFITLVFFYDGHFANYFDSRADLLEELPSTQAGAYTHISEMLSTHLPGHLVVARRLNEQAELDADFLDESCLASNLLEQDEEYMSSYLTLESYQELVGNPDTLIWDPTTALIYSFTVTMLAILLLKRLGMKFWVLDD